MTPTRRTTKCSAGPILGELIWNLIQLTEWASFKKKKKNYAEIVDHSMASQMQLYFPSHPWLYPLALCLYLYPLPSAHHTHTHTFCFFTPIQVGSDRCIEIKKRLCVLKPLSLRATDQGVTNLRWLNGIEILDIRRSYLDLSIPHLTHDR